MRRLPYAVLTAILLVLAPLRVTRLVAGTPALLATVTAVLRPSVAHAAIEEIEATATYHMGDNDSKLVGHRLALMEAKRKALEKAGTYVESMSEVKDFELTRDEVRTYSAGILSVEETRDPKYRMRGKNMEVTVFVKVRVDRDDVARKIAALRKDKETTRQLKETRRKQAESEKKVAALNKQLRTAKKGTKSAQKAQAAREEALTDAEESTLAAHAVVAERYGKIGFAAAQQYYTDNVVPAAKGCYHNLKPKGGRARLDGDGIVLAGVPAGVFAWRMIRVRRSSRGKR